MNKLSWILFAAYFALFAALGIFFYLRYSKEYLKAGETPKAAETKSSQDWIYYAQGNSLYRLNPSLALTSSNQDTRVEMFQSTGEVNSIDISANGQNIAYDEKNNLGFFEVWEVNAINKFSAKIATRGQENLDGYLDYMSPKFSPDGTKMAFVGRKENSDTIFIKDLSNGEFSEMVVPANMIIADYTWTKNGEQIVFCTQKQEESGCWLQEITGPQSHRIIKGEISQISGNLTDNLILLVKKNDTANLYTASTDGANLTPLTDLIKPKIIPRFRVSADGSEITYSVEETNIQNVYACRPDGTNKIQLTNDNTSTQAVIDPTGKKIGYLKDSEGIFVTAVDKTDHKKINNVSSTIRMLIWR